MLLDYAATEVVVETTPLASTTSLERQFDAKQLVAWLKEAPVIQASSSEEDLLKIRQVCRDVPDSSMTPLDLTVPEEEEIEEEDEEMVSEPVAKSPELYQLESSWCEAVNRALNHMIAFDTRSVPRVALGHLVRHVFSNYSRYDLSWYSQNYCRLKSRLP